MKVRREVGAAPHRDSDAVWQIVVELITGADSNDIEQLDAAAGIASSIIADEHPAAKPIVVEGVGPRLVIYGVYGRKAMGVADPDALTWNPTDGDWTMHLPSAPEDLEWSKRALASRAPRIRVYDVEGDGPMAADAEQEASSKVEASAGVDWNIGEI